MYTATIDNNNCTILVLSLCEGLLDTFTFDAVIRDFSFLILQSVAVMQYKILCVI